MLGSPMPIHLEIYHPDRIVIGVARGEITLEEFGGFVRELAQSGAMHYRKIFDVSDAPTFIARLKEEGVLAAGVSPTAVRLVTHLDVGDAEIERAIDALGRAAKTS